MSDDITIPGNPPQYYTLGETMDADEALWTSSGFGGPSIADMLGINGYRVTGRQALEQAAALICVDVLAQDISKATLRLKEKLPNGKGDRYVEADQHPLAEMLALEPNDRHTWVEFIQMHVYHLVMTSNSYVYIRRNRANDPIALVPVPPGRVQDRVNQRSGEVFYDISAATVQEAALLGGEYITAPERDVVHVRQRMLDGFWGYSTLTAGSRALAMGQDLESYQRSQFAGSAADRGFFQRPKEMGSMNDDVFRRTKAQLKKLVQRVRDGDPILLEDGITYQEYRATADKSDMIKSFDKQIEMVCQLWRMPPHKAMHLASVKYENLTALEKQYVKDTLIPLCRLIEQRMAKMLLTRKDRLRYSFEFDRDEMAIADEKEDREWSKMLLDRSAISINEARVGARYNPRDGGDAYIVPVNTVLVDAAGNILTSGSPKQDEPTTEEPDDDDAEEDTDKGLRLVASRD